MIALLAFLPLIGVHIQATDLQQGGGKLTATKAEVEKGKQLVGKSDCTTCHKETAKLIGPAYNEIAKKYALTEKNIIYLSDKIIKGGNGVWGPVPMTPHPAVAKADLRPMIKYILSVK